MAVHFHINTPSPSSLTSRLPIAIPQRRPFPPSKATTTTDSTESDPPAPSEPNSDDAFESRLSDLRFRYRNIGQGKKAQIRKARRSKKGASSGSSSASSGNYLPAVPLKEAMSWGGEKVRFGFSRYSELVNGRAAMVGVVALLLVELATGGSAVEFHTPLIMVLQVYFVLAISAVLLKYEKERSGIWPSK